MAQRNVLVIGASYGALIASKIAMAGHLVTVVGYPREIDRIAANGMSVDIPFRHAGRSEVFHFPAARGPATLAGTWGLAEPDEVRCSDYDLAFLAVQEPQAASPDLGGLFDGLAAAALPMVSLMNMAPLSFLARLPGFDTRAVAGFYYSPEVWRRLMNVPQTLASPDAQAMRPDSDDPSRLKVTLATNLKCAPFADSAAQAILEEIAGDIGRIKTDAGLSVPVRLLATPHLAMPLVKLPMLACGNYRCILPEGIRPICDAVWDNLSLSREVYEFAVEVLRANGVPGSIIVPFERYADAARGLTLPSSAARAIAAGATRIERADLLLQELGARHGLVSKAFDRVVDVTNRRLAQSA